MDAKTQAIYRARAAIVKALAHPTRLFLVDVLRERERCVCDLTALVGDDISTVSKHLVLLKSAGLVCDERVSNKVFYRLRTPCLTKFFSCVEEVLRQNAKSMEETVPI